MVGFWAEVWWLEGCMAKCGDRTWRSHQCRSLVKIFATRTGWTKDRTKDYVLRWRCNMCSFLLQQNYGIIVLCQIVWFTRYFLRLGNFKTSEIVDQGPLCSACSQFRHRLRGALALCWDALFLWNQPWWIIENLLSIGELRICLVLDSFIQFFYTLTRLDYWISFIDSKFLKQNSPSTKTIWRQDAWSIFAQLSPTGAASLRNGT